MGGKGGRCIGLKTLSPTCADILKILESSTSWSPWGLPKPVQGQIYLPINIYSFYTRKD
jgi:hypothetical protein